MRRAEVRPTSRSERLPRTLGLWSSVALVVGITIGSGIFRSPAGIAQKVPHPTVMLLLWVLGGAVTLCGALSLGELAAALPETGGLYAYLREGWGRQPAFLFGWSELVLIRANALGGIAVVFGGYRCYAAWVSTRSNTTSRRDACPQALSRSQRQSIFAAPASAPSSSASPLGQNLRHSWCLPDRPSCSVAVMAATIAHLTTGTGAPLTLGSMGLALVSILWAYDGWADLSFASGEVTNPQRNLPRAIILGTLAIIAIYLLTNVAYLYVNPIETVAQSRLVAADTMLALFGRVGVVLVSAFVMISSFSSLNGSMLASPRVFFAMADDGLFFDTIAKVHPTYNTP